MSEFCSKRYKSANFHQLNTSPLFLSLDSFLKVKTRVKKAQNIHTKKDKRTEVPSFKCQTCLAGEKLPERRTGWTEKWLHTKRKDRQKDLIYNNFLIRTCCLSTKTGQALTMCYTNSFMQKLMLPYEAI